MILTRGNPLLRPICDETTLASFSALATNQLRFNAGRMSAGIDAGRLRLVVFFTL
jgi:hypothetical protein